MEALKTHTVTLGFYDADSPTFQSEKPYVCLVPLTHAPKGFKQTNVEYVDKTVDVRDIRGYEELFQIDIHGFELARHTTSFQDWHDGRKVVDEYYPHVVELLKGALQASSVFVFDHSVHTQLVAYC